MEEDDAVNRGTEPAVMEGWVGEDEEARSDLEEGVQVIEERWRGEGWLH
jgi:hypothetical protein